MVDDGKTLRACTLTRREAFDPDYDELFAGVAKEDKAEGLQGASGAN